MTRRPQHSDGNLTQMQPDADPGIDGQLAVPARRNRCEALQHGVAGGQCFASPVAALRVQAETGHHSIARHVEYRATAFLGGSRENPEELIQERYDAGRRKALGQSRVTAQIGEQHGDIGRMHPRSRPNPRDDYSIRRTQPGTCYSWSRTHVLFTVLVIMCPVFEGLCDKGYTI